MRDLLNLLTESRGIATRNKGDLFTSDKGLEDLYFQNCQFWPENGGKYDQDELLNIIDQISRWCKHSNYTTISQYMVSRSTYLKSIRDSIKETTTPNDLGFGFIPK